METVIELVLAWDAVFNAVTAAAMVVFGAWVLTITPRTRSTKLLALFAVAYGAIYIPSNLVTWTGWERYLVWNPLRGILYVVAAVGLLGLAREVLQPLGHRTRRLWCFVLALTGAMALVPLALTAAWGFPTLDPDAGAGVVLSVLAFRIPYHLYLSAFFALPVVLAWVYRHPSAGREDVTRAQAALLSGALVLWPALYGGSRFSWLADPTVVVNNFPIHAALLVAGFVGLAGLWLGNARAVPDRRREASAMALLILGVVLVGMVNAVVLNPHVWPRDGPVWGIARLVSVVAIGYAILRHQVLGIEAKFRGGVSKTAVAGAFIVVFFVVSEGAQVLFADVVGSELLGILAAGALLFGLAPIQRVADHLAEMTVPAGPAGGATHDEQRYRTAVDMALADGEITRSEERRLAELAEDLDLAPTRALELREQVERDQGGGTSP